MILQDCYISRLICFLIGEERATCGGSKLTNAPGNFRLARDQVVHLETAGNSCTSRPDVEVGQRFSLEKAFIIQEKGFIITKTYQISKREE